MGFGVLIVPINLIMPLDSGRKKDHAWLDVTPVELRMTRTSVSVIFVIK